MSAITRTILVAVLCISAMGVRCALALDSNQNGLSDVWEALYPGMAPFDDPNTGDICQPIIEDNPDHDPWNNEQESDLGTDPTSYQSGMPLGISYNGTSGLVELRLTTVIGKIYELQNATAVEDPHEIEECGGNRTVQGYYQWTSFYQIVGNGNEWVVSVTPPPEGEPALFRYALVGDTDSDVDDLNAWEEAVLGTSDSESDFDGDLLPDGWEFTCGLSPTFDEYGFGLRTQFYIHDAADRLTEVESILNETFGYDNEANITTAQ
jgi:hypothetical protein